MAVSSVGTREPGLAEVQQFLERLGQAVTSGDGQAAAELWAVPALVLGDTEARSIATLDEVAQFFGGAKAQYNARGIEDTRPEIRSLRWLTPRIALVEVRWPWLNGNGEEVGEETSTYTLKRDDAGALRLQAAFLHGAAEE